MKDVLRIDISWHTLWKIVVFGLAVAAMFLAREVVGILFASIVISLGLDPIVSFLEGKKVNRILGTLIVFLGSFFVIAVVGYFVIPVFVIEASAFLKQFHDFMSAIFGIGFPETIVETLIFGRDRILDLLVNADISVADTVKRFFSSAIFFAGTVLTTFYLSVEKNGTERLLRVVLPDQYEKPVLQVFGRFKMKIRRWMAAQLSLSILIGVIVGVGLWFLGVRYSFVLGVIAAVLELVPVIGPIVVGLIAFMIAVSDSFLLGIYAILFFFIVQQLENHLLIPVIMGRSMKVHPVVVLAALLAGGKIAGILGVILAVPIAVIAQEIFEYIAERKDGRNQLV